MTYVKMHSCIHLGVNFLKNTYFRTKKPENHNILGFNLHLGDEYYTVLFI